MASGIIIFLLCEIGAVSLSNLMTPGVKGPAFLFYYFFLWFILRGISKWNNWNAVLPLIIYVSAGLTRFFEGKEYGMSRFGFLWLMMLGGGFVYFLLAVGFVSGESSGGGSGSSGGCGSSGCGGGGGGGGCGGGCGGCGGD
ncbi:MAG: hypothetical protein D3906_15345 [Candidatus Electrothrix sp. AUS1_2]|nr:hypothetical protein [Candidatus Electrothrix sp. AUS1_2]